MIDGEGLDSLKDWIASQARTLIPSTEQPGLNEREAGLLVECHGALSRVLGLNDPVLIAEELRLARGALDRVSGISGVDDLLDALFGRFCLGK